MLFGAVAVVAAGCGSGKKSTVATISAIPHGAGSAAAAFVARANRICVRTNSAVKTVRARSAQIRPYVDAAVSIVDRGVSELTALTPPPTQRAGYRQYLSALAQVVALDHEIKSDADSGRIGRIGPLNQQLEGVHAKEHAAAKLLGLTECAKQPSQ